MLTSLSFCRLPVWHHISEIPPVTGLFRSHARHLTVDEFGCMTGDATHARHIGLDIVRLQVFRVDAPDTAAVQFGLLGLSIYRDIAHAAALHIHHVCQDLVQPEGAYAGVLHVEDVGVQTVEADSGGSGIPDLGQIGGIDRDVHVLRVDVDVVLGKVDVQRTVITVKVE